MNERRERPQELNIKEAPWRWVANYEARMSNYGTPNPCLISWSSQIREGPRGWRLRDGQSLGWTEWRGGRMSIDLRLTNHRATEALGCSGPGRLWQSGCSGKPSCGLPFALRLTEACHFLYGSCSTRVQLIRR